MCAPGRCRRRKGGDAMAARNFRSLGRQRCRVCCIRYCRRFASWCRCLWCLWAVERPAQDAAVLVITCECDATRSNIDNCLAGSLPPRRYLLALIYPIRCSKGPQNKEPLPSSRFRLLTASACCSSMLDHVHVPRESSSTFALQLLLHHPRTVPSKVCYYEGSRL